MQTREALGRGHRTRRREHQERTALALVVECTGEDEAAVVSQLLEDHSVPARSACAD